MDSTITMLSAWPDLIWAAVAGSTLTLVGVFLQNRGEGRRNAERLTHDAQQRETERKMAHRRETYAEVASAGAQMSRHLALILYDTEDAGKNSMFEGVFSALYRAHIVGSEKVLEGVARVNNAFTKASYELHLMKMESTQKDFVVQEVKGELEELCNERDSLFPSNESNLSLEEYGQLRDDVAELQSEITKIKERWDGLSSEHRAFRNECIQRSHELSRTLSKEMVELNIAMREDLGLPVENDVYRAIVDAEWEEGEFELNKFTKQVSEVIEQGIDDAGRDHSKSGFA